MQKKVILSLSKEIWSFVFSEENFTSLFLIKQNKNVFSMNTKIKNQIGYDDK